MGGPGLGLLALGPGLRRGFLLSYDMVAVPRESFTAGHVRPVRRPRPGGAQRCGAGRALPGGAGRHRAETPAADHLRAGLLGCGGPARPRSPGSRAWPPGSVYTWNPFVAERLIIGQWALLLGYAGLPWALRAAVAGPVASWPGAGRLLAGLLPAAAGGFAAMSVSALVVLPAAVLGPARAGGIPALGAGGIPAGAGGIPAGAGRSRPGGGWPPARRRWLSWSRAACPGWFPRCCAPCMPTRTGWPRTPPGRTLRSGRSAAC